MENKEFYIDHDGILLHAKLDFPKGFGEGGKCPLLVVLHGLTGHMEEAHIRGVADTALSLGFAALRVELYGHGMSGGEFRRHTVMKWLDEMQTVIGYAAGLEFVTDLYLAGHSQGGLTTILAGGMYADRLKAILPLSAATVIHTGAKEGVLFAMRYDPDHVPDSVELYEGKTLDGGYLRAARFLPVEEAVRSYHGPVLLVHGEADESVPFACSQVLAAQYKNARLAAIPEDDHCYNRHLDMVLEAVADFLRDCEEGRI